MGLSLRTRGGPRRGLAGARQSSRLSVSIGGTGRASLPPSSSTAARTAGSSSAWKPARRSAWVGESVGGRVGGVWGKLGAGDEEGRGAHGRAKALLALLGLVSVDVHVLLEAAADGASGDGSGGEAQATGGREASAQSTAAASSVAADVMVCSGLRKRSAETHVMVSSWRGGCGRCEGEGAGATQRQEKGAPASGVMFRDAASSAADDSTECRTRLAEHGLVVRPARGAPDRPPPHLLRARRGGRVTSRAACGGTSHVCASSPQCALSG